jgi:hypothetical protein
VFLSIIPLTGDTNMTEVLDPWPAGKFNPKTLRQVIEPRFTRLLSKEFAKGPLSDILTWLAGKITERCAAEYVIGLMKQALQDWKLDALGSANVS